MCVLILAYNLERQQQQKKEKHAFRCAVVHFASCAASCRGAPEEQDGGHLKKMTLRATRSVLWRQKSVVSGPRPATHHKSIRAGSGRNPCVMCIGQSISYFPSFCQRAKRERAGGRASGEGRGREGSGVLALPFSSHGSWQQQQQQQSTKRKP